MAEEVVEKGRVAGVGGASERADRTEAGSPRARATADSTCLETEASTALIRDAKVTKGAVALDEVSTDEPAVTVDVVASELTVGGVVPDKEIISLLGTKTFTKKTKDDHQKMIAAQSRICRLARRSDQMVLSDRLVALKPSCHGCAHAQ